MQGCAESIYLYISHNDTEGAEQSRPIKTWNQFCMKFLRKVSKNSKEHLRHSKKISNYIIIIAH